MKLLNIGAGDHPLDGWTNADVARAWPFIVYLDATKPFEFPDDEWDRIYSEHMIEHITFAEGCHMLRECYRVLKPGGRIRITTPNLAFLTEMFYSPKKYREYIDWASREFGMKSCPETVINNFVRAWGHQFIWSEFLLRHTLHDVGFENITEHRVRESRDPAFKFLENVDRMPSGFLAIESMCLEALKS